jgi:nitrite reductase (NO-forming)
MQMIMKRKFLFVPALVLSAAIISCGSDKPKHTADSMATTTAAVTEPEAAVDKGKEVYDKTCKACHQENGLGMPKTFPPLAKSDFLGDRKAVIEQVINGKTGPLTVNGEEYNSTMPPQKLNDEEIAAVLTYVYSNWENTGAAFTADEVKTVRDGLEKK